MYTLGDYCLQGRVECSKLFFDKEPYNQLPIAILIILLKGGFSVEKISLRKTIIQNIDYTILGTDTCKPNQLSSYISNITSQHSHIRISDNFNFYKSLLVEYCACMHAEKLRHGVTSMLYTYRILERMSYALPLLYAKKSDDFRYTYNTIKSFFENSNSKLGELGFFKKSLTTILDTTEKSFKFSFKIEEHEKDALNICLSQFDQSIFYENEGIIKFDLSIFDTIGLLINTRNSFFHALSGKRHISLEELTDPDKTFLKLTSNFINALSFLLAKIAEPSLLP